MGCRTPDFPFDSAKETLLEVAADPKHLGARIGVLMVLHTWGQKLEHHPHVHCVVPGGGLAVPTPAPGATATESAAQAPRWVSCRPDWFLPVLVLSPVFRGKYLAALRQTYHAGELQFAGSTAPLASPQAWRTLVRTLYQKEWVVYAKEPFGGPEQVLKYLTGYTHRVALSNRRLVKLQDDRVTFTWKDYANGCRRKEMTLDAWEFVRRFALHIVPKGLVRIRRFGLLAHRDRGERLALCRSLLAAPAEAAGVGDTVAEPPRPSGLSSEDAPATSCAVPVPPTVQPQPASATRIGVAVLAVLISLVVSSGDISWLRFIAGSADNGDHPRGSLPELWRGPAANDLAREPTDIKTTPTHSRSGQFMRPMHPPRISLFHHHPRRPGPVADAPHGAPAARGPPRPIVTIGSIPPILRLARDLPPSSLMAAPSWLSPA